jgi:hypothetical protein
VEECTHGLDPVTCTICLGKYTTASDPPPSEGQAQCAEAGCIAEHKTDEWNSKRAHNEGWFIQKNGDRWCPDHNPEWVEEWRKRQ